MQRRDLLKGMALAGGPTAGTAQAAGAPATTNIGSSVAGQAGLELAAAMAEAEQRYSTPPFGSTDPVEAADARRFMAETLQTALLFWADADPDRPSFTRFIGPHQKLL